MTRHVSGTTARLAGQAWEDALGNYHSYLAAQGLAVVHKTGPQVTFTKLRGQVGPVVTGPGPADYVGVLADGRFVGFEAKSTSATSGYTLPEKSLHQLYWLDAIRRTSGGRAKAFYIVLYRTENETRLHRLQDILPGKRLRRSDGIVIPDGISWIDMLKYV